MSCGSDIDLFLHPPLTSLRLNCFAISITLSVSKDHIERISCCLADFWALASPTLAAVSCLITCTMCVSLCMCVYTSMAVESLYIRSVHMIFVPFEVHACVCVCVWAICFLRSLRRRDDSLALLCLSTCCMWGAGSPPVPLTSPLSAPLTSCPLTESPV